MDENNNNVEEQPKQADDTLTWTWRKQTHVDTLTEDEIKRVLKEKQDHRLQQDREREEHRRATLEVEKKFYDDLLKDCTSGTPEERLPKALIRAAQKGCFLVTPARPQRRVQTLKEYFRLHNITIKDGKEKLTSSDYRKAYMEQELFVMDVFIHKGEVNPTHPNTPQPVKQQE
jgi:hypothetical protein